MRFLVYPADDHGCGHYRLIWPAQALQAQGHDVTVVTAEDRHLRIHFDPHDASKVANVEIEPGYDAVVFQRTTDRRLLEVFPWLRARGIAVIIDVDDDLTSIHPSNPAWTMLDPNRAARETKLAILNGQVPREKAGQLHAMLLQGYNHSWHHLTEACKRATLVTVSTPNLIKKYAAHGRGRVLPNFAPDHYLDVVHEDSDVIGWPAALYSHPNDPAAVGNAVARIVSDGAKFITVGDPVGVGRAFGMTHDPEGADVDFKDWPTALTKIGIGIAPLADTQFNGCKSRLKCIELSAVGVPWVASPRDDYVRLHAYGAGVLADKPKDWYRTLRDLRDDPSRRVELSQMGRAVARGLRLTDNAWRFLEAWTDAVELERSGAATGGATGGTRYDARQPV